jgi:hypothetical protein
VAEPVAPAVKPTPAAKPAPVRKAAFVDLVPVMEEEFQHAITHGKARVFEKWTSLQTRNRILNAIPVENEMHTLLAVVFVDGQKVEVG